MWNKTIWGNLYGAMNGSLLLKDAMNAFSKM
jgi:hypothetical protein